MVTVSRSLSLSSLWAERVVDPFLTFLERLRGTPDVESKRDLAIVLVLYGLTWFSEAAFAGPARFALFYVFFTVVNPLLDLVFALVAAIVGIHLDFSFPVFELAVVGAVGPLVYSLLGLV